MGAISVSDEQVHEVLARRGIQPSEATAREYEVARRDAAAEVLATRAAPEPAEAEEPTPTSDLTVTVTLGERVLAHVIIPNV